MSSEYHAGPNANSRHPSSELWGSWEIAGEETLPFVNQQEPPTPVDPQSSYREHVTGVLRVDSSERRLSPQAQPPQAYAAQRPAYPPLPPQYIPQGPPTQAYPGYQGYPPAYMYPGSAYAPYAWQLPQPKRDGYLFGMAITSVVGASLALLAGLAFAGLLVFYTALLQSALITDQRIFTGVAGLLAFASAGILGGTFGLYHSIRSLMRKPSAAFALPWFWIFLVLYILALGFGFVLQAQGQEVAFPGLTASLIVLTAILPAFTVVALGVRRLRPRLPKPLKAQWSTTWRRFTLALASGATLSITLASVLEFVLLLLLVLLTHVQGLQNLTLNTDPSGISNTGFSGLLLFVIAVIAPLIEETVKPLAVVILIGRVRSASEAFVLGLACGIGFDLVETALYISTGYHAWLTVALERTGTGLLHGFGAAMVALGWYYLTHAKKHRWLLAFGCWFYAVLQHAVWNGSQLLSLLPAPIGPFVQNWTLNLGFVSLPFDLVANILETILILVFFIYLTGRLKKSSASPAQERDAPMESEARVASFT